MGLIVSLFESVYPQQKVAHIYIDLASLSSLAQMVDVVEQPLNNPKLLIWKRFHALSIDDPLLKHINAKMPDAKFLGEFNYMLFSDLVDKNVSDFYQNYSDYVYDIHLNLAHIPRSGRIFDIIPPSQIRSIHLYEDAIGRSLWDKRTIDEYNSIETSAPKYLHVGFWDPNTFASIRDKIIKIDFQEKALSLSALQKEMIARMTGLDLAQLSALKRPTILFADDPSLDLKRTEEFFKSISQKKELKSYLWLYKNHPRVARGEGIALKFIKKYFNKVYILPNEIPIEVLILCGYEPSYIAGYGSSLFFSFKSNQILAYIERNYLEMYLKPLLDLGILTKDKIFHVNQDVEKNN